MGPENEGDEDQEDSGAWRLTIWGAHAPGAAERPLRRRGDWTHRTRQIWGVPPAALPPDDRAEPLLPIIELAPAPIEDIIPLPPNPPLAPMDADLWPAVADHDEHSGPDIWEVRRGGRVTVRTNGRFVLPDRWDAGPRRRSILAKWLGQD